MLIARRQFITSLGAAAATALLARRATAFFEDGPRPFQSLKLERGGFVLGGLEDGGRVLAIPTDAGLIMIDAKFWHTTGRLLESIKQTAGGEPTLLINTHHHPDHSGGNWRFNSAAKIVAHRNLVPRLDRNLATYRAGVEGQLRNLRMNGAPEAEIAEALADAERLDAMTVADFAPDETISTAEQTIEHGGVELRLHHFGPGHTDNDLAIHVPSLNVIHMGDMVFHELHPFIDRRAGATTRGWQKSLAAAFKLCDEETIVIPGHGEIADRSAITAMSEYFDQLRTFVSEAMERGDGPDAIARAEPEVFKSRGFKQMQNRALAAMYEELLIERQGGG